MNTGNGANDRLVYGCIGGLVGVVLLIVLAVVLVDAYKKKKREGGGGSGVKAVAAKVNGGAKWVQNRIHTAVRARLNATGQSGSSEMPPLAPLWWDKQEGAYMIQLYMGDGPVSLVLDTGSSTLSAKVNGCVWTQCEEGGGKCTTKACPCSGLGGGSNCELHYYKPSAAGYPVANSEAVMQYGSQEDTVSQYVDKIVIPKLSLTCQQLVQGSKRMDNRLLMRLMQSSNRALTANMVVNQVHRIKGISSSNLFGIARPYGNAVVLNKLFEAVGHGAARVWSMLLMKHSGWWALGAIPCFDNKHVMPLVEPSGFKQYVTKFYILPVLSMQAGPTMQDLAFVSSRAAPQYCLVDTGTTYTYGSVHLGAALDKLGYDERTWYVRLTLGDKRAPVQLTYSSDQLRDPDMRDSSVLQVTDGRTLANFHDLFGNMNVLLLGAYMMQNMYWEFNLSAHTVAVQAV